DATLLPPNAADATVPMSLCSCPYKCLRGQANALPKVLDCCASVIERLHAERLQSVEPARTAIPNRCSLAQAGSNKSLPFESFQSSVNCACCDLTLQTHLNFP